MALLRYFHGQKEVIAKCPTPADNGIKKGSQHARRAFERVGGSARLRARDSGGGMSEDREVMGRNLDYFLVRR
jgi:hypothetical protein